MCRKCNDLILVEVDVASYTAQNMIKNCWNVISQKNDIDFYIKYTIGEVSEMYKDSNSG